MSAAVELDNLRRTFSGVVAVDDVTLDIASGEFFTLLGSSGSGKTTTLMMVAGFVEPEKGDIRIGGRSVVAAPPEKRGLGVVFQSYALFPHMTVAQNVAYPLKMRRTDAATVERKVREALALVDLQGFGERRIGQLSGGQQQRVALARAIVFEPPVLLMDEPLGALDRKLREQLQGELKRIQQALGITVIYVTHDQEEALILSDRIAVMADGRIQQVGHPAEVYENPTNLFVAGFLGESNLVAGRLEPAAEGARVTVAGTETTWLASRTLPVGPVRVMVRPESVRLAPAGQDGGGLPGTVASIDYLGAIIRYVVQTPAGPLSARISRGEGGAVFAKNDPVRVSWRPEQARLFDEAGRAVAL